MMKMESSFDKLRMNVSWIDKLTMDTFILSLSKDGLLGAFSDET